jgi:hypothetical protein
MMVDLIENEINRKIAGPAILQLPLSSPLSLPQSRLTCVIFQTVTDFIRCAFY